MDPAPASVSDPEQWLDLHGDALFRYALTRLRRRQDAEDAVQETLLAALAARRDFRGEAAERTWLIGILRHKIVDRIRADVRAPVVGDAADDMDWCGDTGNWLHPPKAWQGDPQQLSEDRAFWEQVRSCFATLPDRQAQAFALRTMDGLPADEVCKQLGITPTNLWVLLHRARTRLRDCLERTWFAPEGRKPS
jgi:RNA polymerase sigma-70 factor (ECF subfamily)